jgi:hypothetical protein
MNQRHAAKSFSDRRQPATLSRQFLAIIISSFAAILANILLYSILENLLGIKFIAPNQFPPPEVSPLPVTDVIIFSAVFSSGASLVFLAVANLVQRPAMIFAIISFIVLVASFYLPLRIPTPPIPLATKLALVSMHILGAAVLVPLLIIIGLPRKDKERFSRPSSS